MIAILKGGALRRVHLALDVRLDGVEKFLAIQTVVMVEDDGAH